MFPLQSSRALCRALALLALATTTVLADSHALFRVAQQRSTPPAASATAPAFPVIEAATPETAIPGLLYTYRIVASPSSVTYRATGLPAGLSLDADTGEIRGVCGRNLGTYVVTLQATNALGTATATQVFQVAGDPPIEMPYVAAVIPPAEAAYRVGDTLVFRLLVRPGYGHVNVTGQPRFAFTLGANIRYATYASGSGTEYHVYTYTIAPGDAAASGLTTSDTLDLNGGTLQDNYPLWCALTLPPVTAPGVHIEPLTRR